MAQANRTAIPDTHAAVCRSQDKYLLILKERKVLENDIQTENQKAPGRYPVGAFQEVSGNIGKPGCLVAGYVFQNHRFVSPT